ncbi:MAG TPA: hypothetical protein VF503_27615 [Sphingobium sp.]|uniref:hypothetical protein n=1 Tax=Sphingobium sp. TaxID=1912891 RepID=UPI002ED44810
MDMDKIETRSAERRPFEHYLRTGQWPAEPLETKFNPNHDPANGQFTSGPGGARSGMAPPPAPHPSTPRTPAAHLPTVRPAAPQASTSAPRTRPIKGYAETGKDGWRKANDAVFEKTADDFNRQNGLKPGDPRHMDPQLMKAWAMVESGGDKQAFLSDPFQVNKPGDAATDKLKLLKLTKGQVMTPDVSAKAALVWLDHKANPKLADGHGGLTPKYIGLRKGFERYNANTNIDKNGNIHYVNYPDLIFSLYGSVR